MSAPDTDIAWMARAIELARGQLGHTAPNPSVGCIIVADNKRVSEGATGDGGRPHAEETAISLAGELARGATAYVSLEPCSERSSGAASCARLLIDAGVARVVFGCADPNPDASDGLVMLTDAGVEVEANVLQDEASRVNCGFFKRLSTGRPWLAIAFDDQSFDGEFDLRPNETFESALDRLGAAGLTRVWVRTGTPLAAQLSARGLVDEAVEAPSPK